MRNYQQNYQEESKYLEKTLSLLKEEISKQNKLLSKRKASLRASRKDMWENSVHFTDDFDKLTEVNQHLSEVSNKTVSYSNTATQIKKYKKMLESPYFGGFDFMEDDLHENERIYIGLYNLMDSETHDIVVYDWRAPISSIFYQYELGKASYKAPFGIITGNVLLKRQYKIQKSQLKYFFDCSVIIDDEILQQVLSKNSSAKMRNIVETIQKEQDIVIRDTDNELLIVQGPAGSGKTSIALHRIAFLLYHGINSDINFQNIIIISPNTIFGKYISTVLPELGEENVNQITFDDDVAHLLKGKGALERRESYLEFLMTSKNTEEVSLKKQSLEFKNSRMFVEILNRLIVYYERHIIAFDDIYYDGKMIESKQRLKNFFLNNKIKVPAAKRLKRIEHMILKKVHSLQKKRLRRIEEIVAKKDEHQFEIKAFSRLLSIKQSKILLNRIRNFTEIDYYSVYSLLFTEQGLLKKLAHGLALPCNIQKIVTSTKENIDNVLIGYEDCAPLLYLKLKLEGSGLFSNIKHVVIDEAQDYSPMHYEVFNLLFSNANYTVLGDVNQSIHKDVDFSLYDTAVKIFEKKKATILSLEKSYRSSFEINAFNQKLLNRKSDIVSFERHEVAPMIVYKDNLESIYGKMIEDIAFFLEEGYQSVAVVCKTALESKQLYDKLKNVITIQLVDSNDNAIEHGVLIIPTYMAKGLEFDAVLVFNVTRDHYYTEFDRRLLYVACTRALHRLVLYYTGEKSPLLL